MIKIAETNDYEELKKFFIKNGLEAGEDDPVPPGLVKCWKMTDEGADPPKLIGGIVLAVREGEFIIDGIAVDPDYRGQDAGTALLALAIEQAGLSGGERIYLVARAPGFFRTRGFKTVPRENAPEFFECNSCPQYGTTCFPEVMKLSNILPYSI